MTLTVKPFTQITADMIAHARAINASVTDYNIGSVARMLMEAPAVEIDALYEAFIAGLLEAIPTAIFVGFDFDALDAQAASGYVTFTIEEEPASPVTIPSGTLCRDPTVTTLYATQEDAVLSSLTAVVRVAATTTGVSTNAVAGAVTAYTPIIDDVTVSNPSAILGGAEEETDDEQRQRFARYIQSLARGTVASLEYAAIATTTISNEGLIMERCTKALVTETPGHVNLYVYSGLGTPSDTLIDAIEQVIEGYIDPDTEQRIPGYRPAGMRVDVLAFTEVEIDIDIDVYATEGDQTDALKALIEDAIVARLAETTTELRPADIISTVVSFTEVSGVTLHDPTSVVTITPGTLLVLGTLTLTWA